MSGDAGFPQHYLRQQDGELPEMDYAKAEMLMDRMENRNRGLLILRRNAASELRMDLHRYRWSPNYQDRIIDIFVKVLKRPNDDQMVVEQILWIITNLASKPTILHLMLKKVGYF